PEAKHLIEYLQGLGARNLTLSGQHEDIWFNQSIEIIYQYTPGYPAIRGVEIGLCAAESRLQEIYDLWHVYGVIPALTWHDVVPDVTDTDPDSGGRCVDSCSFNCVHDQRVNLKNVITPGTSENSTFTAQMN